MQLTAADEVVVQHRLPVVANNSARSRLVEEAATIAVWGVAVVLVIGITIWSVMSANAVVIATGVVEPFRVWPIRAPNDGLVKEVLVSDGDMVEQGQTLVRLDTVDASVAMADARGRYLVTKATHAYDSAEFEIERLRAKDTIERSRIALVRARAAAREQLVNHGVTISVDSALKSYRIGTHIGIDLALGAVMQAIVDSQSAATEHERARVAVLRVERSQAEYHRVANEYRAIQTRWRSLTIRSPIRGAVLTPFIDNLAGRIARKGDVLFEVVDRTGWRVVVTVSERDVHRVRVGDTASIEIPALAEILQSRLWATVEEVAAEPSKSDNHFAEGAVPASTPPRGFPVILRLEATDEHGIATSLKRGYTVKAHIVTRRQTNRGLRGSLRGVPGFG
jgi:multidrug efflux pump subunit AcrA (membrane-fusion protein)